MSTRPLTTSERHRAPRWKTLGAAALAIGIAAAVAVGGPASAKSSSKSKTYPGGKITAYVYIQDRADVNGCGDFTTRASATTKLSYITNYVDWDPIGIGATASIKGAGTSVAGNNSASPSAKVTNRNAKSAGISGVVCMSWTTIYLGVFSTAETKVKGTLYPISTHV